MKISYGITVHNESEELNKLLEILVHKTDKEDEIVICVDGDDDAVRFVLDSWTQQYAHTKTIKVYQRKLENDFAAQKNSVIENSKGDYIFHIDADEIPNEVLLKQLPQILEINDTDLVWVPRINIVNGITEFHMNLWKWRQTEQGWINFPDYQARIFRNVDHIKWVKPVHEVIDGATTYSHLPPHEELTLKHEKEIARQEVQNKLYDQII